MEHHSLQQFFQGALASSYQHHIEVHFVTKEGKLHTRTISQLITQHKAAKDINTVYQRSEEVKLRIGNLGHGIRHAIKEIKGGNESIASIHLVASQHILQDPLKAMPFLGEAEADAIAEMNDEEFENHLNNITHEVVTSLEGKPHRLAPEVSRQLGKNLAADFKKSNLPLTARHDEMRNNLIIKLAIRLVALAICQNAREERRVEAKREEQEQVEKKELSREILKSEILKDSLSRQEMEKAILETLHENVQEEKQASEDDLRAVAKALVDLVWLGLPKAFIAGI